MKTQNRLCEFCTFYDPQRMEQEFGGATIRENIEGLGFCRVHPPTIGHMGVGKWPIVSHADWCGHYRDHPFKMRGPEVREIRNENGDC